MYTPTQSIEFSDAFHRFLQMLLPAMWRGFLQILSSSMGVDAGVVFKAKITHTFITMSIKDDEC
jgi:hypothetical protein